MHKPAKHRKDGREGTIGTGLCCGVVWKTIVLLGVVGVDVLGARARRAQSF